MRIDVRDRAVGENEAHIETNQRTAPSEHKSHKPANVAVFLDTVAVVDPNERQVLHVMEDFEQGDAHEDV